MLRDHLDKYFFDGKGYNCAETILRAANDYYGLGIPEQDLILVGGFGGGVQTGGACGALLAAVAVLSRRYIATKAHDSDDIKPAVQLLTAKVTERFGSVNCCDIRPQVFDTVGTGRCIVTVRTLADQLEETIAEYERGRRA